MTIAPTDSRHGSTRGYHAGCREVCCRRAIARDEKARRLERLKGGRAVPALGAQRRLQALMRLGWSSAKIAEAAGLRHRNHVLRVLNGQKGKPTRWIERSTDQWVRRVYAELCMKLPTGPHVERTRAHAERQGWVVPLAWNDIDHDPAPVGLRERHRSRDDYDEVVVLRMLEGDRIQSNRAEKEEAMRRWVAMGRTKASLCKLMGWHEGRYGAAGVGVSDDATDEPNTKEVAA